MILNSHNKKDPELIDRYIVILYCYIVLVSLRYKFW